MKKHIYQTPEMEITRFTAEDIIRTSGLVDDRQEDYMTEILPDFFDLNS